MIRSKIQKYEMLTRTANFAAKNVSVFPTETAAATLAKDLQAVVDKLSETKASQGAGRDQLRTSSEQRLAKQQELRSQVEAIHQTAGALKIGGFSLPENPRVSALFDTARNYAEAVGPLQAEFILHGLPSEFIQNLKSAADELRGAIESQVATRGRRKAAIQEFDKALDEGLRYLQRFEVLLMNTMSDNAAVMASWQVARQVERVRSSKRAGDAPPATPSSAPKPEVASTA